MGVQKVEIIHIELGYVATLQESFHGHKADGVGLMVMVATFQDYVLSLGAVSIENERANGGTSFVAEDTLTNW